MHLKSILLAFAAALLIPVAATAQTDSIHQLPPAEVTASRLEQFGAGLPVQRPDTTPWYSPYRAGHLGTLLQDASSGIFLRNYGPGALLTIASRGADAQQTALLWNGFNLQSPMNGVFDLNLMPLWMVDEVVVQPGGPSALWGSGAIGGAVLVNNALQAGKGTEASVMGSGGSFGMNAQGLRLRTGGERWGSHSRLYRQGAVNNFRFQHPVDGEVRQEHARFGQWAGQQELVWQPGVRDRIVARVWYQEADREVAPTLQWPSNATQEDRYLRAMAEWQHEAGRVTTYLRSAFMQEYFGYEDKDPNWGFAYENLARTAIAEGFLNWHQSDAVLLSLGFHGAHTTAETDFYEGTATQQRFALLANGRWVPVQDKLSVAASFRQEFNTVAPAPLTGSLSARWQPLAWLEAHALVSRNYRIPNLNDLFWAPGGNPDLLPENSWNAEAGLAATHTKDGLTLRAGAKAYHRITDNWIQWVPGDSVWMPWSPQNVLKVWSRGIETEASVGWQQGKTLLRMEAQYAHTLSTRAEAALPGDPALDKQLVYIPPYQALARLHMQHGAVWAGYWHTFTGVRYTTADNSMSLPAFNLGHAAIGVNVQVWQRQCRLALQGHNLWNTNYQVMEARPMPLRYVEASVIFDLHRRK